MGFETVVLAKVAEVLGDNRLAEFAHGSLFIRDITSGQTLLVQRVLMDMCGCKIETGRLEDEVYFDFVA